MPLHHFRRKKAEVKSDKQRNKQNSLIVSSLTKEIKERAGHVPVSTRNCAVERNKNIDRVQSNHIIAQFNRRKTILEGISKQNQQLHWALRQQKSTYSQSTLLKNQPKIFRNSPQRARTQQGKQLIAKSQEKQLRICAPSPRRKNGMSYFDRTRWQQEAQEETALHRYIQSHRKWLIKDKTKTNSSQASPSKSKQKRHHSSTRSLPSLKQSKLM